MLSLGKSLVVIVNYALNNRAAGPLWSGAILSRQTAPDPLPAWKGSGGTTYPGGSPQPKQLGAPDLPRSPGPPRSTGPLPGPGPGPSYTIRTPQRSRTYTPPGAGPEPPRVTCPHAGAGTRAGPRGFHWKTRLPTAFNAVGGSAHCHSKARGGFGQVALLVACYQGAQSSRWRRLLRVCQPTMPVGYDGSASPIKAPTR